MLAYIFLIMMGLPKIKIMRPILLSRGAVLLMAVLFFTHFPASGQRLSDFKVETQQSAGEPSVRTNISFNGYTNHWHDYYTQWHRYGNLFKIAFPQLQPTILQSKVDTAEDLGMPGLLMQEGFISRLFSNSYATVENPSLDELEKLITRGNTLVITDPSTPAGRALEEKAAGIFEWAGNLGSHQFGAVDLEMIRAFYLVNGNNNLFVISSASGEKKDRLQELIANTRGILDQYNMHKGWLGITTLTKTVTITPGHPLELIGRGMNEGHSWFIFNGYIARYGKEELQGWVSELDLPVVANVGYSPVFGRDDYENLQVQDFLASRQKMIDYAHEGGGYIFRPVYDPASDNYNYDGHIVHPGNKEQIDNEEVPFINMAGRLDGNMTNSMVLFIEKQQQLTHEAIWEAIMGRKAVAVLEEALMMGPARYRNALQLLYLDREYLEDYYNDRLDMHAEVVDDYNLVVTLKNYSSSPVTGNLEITTRAINAGNLPGQVTLGVNEQRQISIPLQPGRDAMGRTNPVAVDFSWGDKKKGTVTMLDLPPAISMHQLLYGHAPQVHFPVTVHNFSGESSFPVEVEVYRKGNNRRAVFRQTLNSEAKTASFQQLDFRLDLDPGDYIVRAKALGATSESQLGVGKPEGRAFVYEIDLNSDGVSEYRMENDSVRISLLRTGARVIEYIVKSKDDNVLFKIWPEKTYNHRAPHRMRGFYPYGGFEDFLGQASMETHQVYDARIVKDMGDYVQVEMETDYYGNQIKKIFTLYGNSPLLEVRFELTFKNPEANVLGPQPILELGQSHGPEDVYILPAIGGHIEYRMVPEAYYGAAIDLEEGWNAGYDTMEDINFVGAFPVAQPIFLHMWMNTPANREAPHYYVEFQPWTPIIQKSTMYFTYYLWGSAGAWENGVDELRKRNLITTQKTRQHR
jgi:hypothetical protein